MFPPKCGLFDQNREEISESNQSCPTSNNGKSMKFLNIPIDPLKSHVKLMVLNSDSYKSSQKSKHIHTIEYALSKTSKSFIPFSHNIPPFCLFLFIA